MEKLKHVKDCLMSCVQNQVSGNLHNVDAKELGEAIDMIKDLEEAIYYATITKAMEEKPLQQQQQQQPQYQQNYNGGRQYNEPNYMPNPNMNYNSQNYMDNASRNYREGGSNNSRSYASSGRGGNSGGGGGNSSYMPSYMDDGAMGMGQHERDAREGTSPMYRKMYMESKEMKQDKTKQMKDLENYMQELSNDIVEMISDASPEERQMLHQKICMLATKVK